MDRNTKHPLKILIDPYPAHGHFSAALAMADRLRSNGHEVHFIGLYDMKRRVVEKGFSFSTVNTVLLRGLDTYRRIYNQSQLFRQCFIWWRSGERKASFDRSLKIHDQIVAKIKPDLILVDEHYGYKVQLYMRSKVPIASFQTMVNLYEGPNCPPINSGHVPEDTKQSIRTVSNLWKKEYKLRARNYWKDLLFFGQDLMPIMRGVMKRSSVRWTPMKNRSFGIGVAEIPNYQLSPASFGLPGEPLKGQLHFPIPKMQSQDNLSHPIVNEVRSRLAQRPELSVIYCSMGTISPGDKDVVDHFFRSLVAVASSMQEALFVISWGKYLDVNTLGEIPQNILSAPFLPQTSLLAFADLMIGHGGLNGIKEAIWEQVPMIIYPVTNQGDHPGNAARVVYHGLGIMGKIDGISAGQIERDIQCLTSDYPKFKSSVQSMRDQFEKSSKRDIPPVHGLAL